MTRYKHGIWKVSKNFSTTLHCSSQVLIDSISIHVPPCFALIFTSCWYVLDHLTISFAFCRSILKQNLPGYWNSTPRCWKVMAKKFACLSTPFHIFHDYSSEICLWWCRLSFLSIIIVLQILRSAAWHKGKLHLPLFFVIFGC